jgi:hypothetical protein
MDHEIELEFELEIDDLRRNIFVNVHFIDETDRILFGSTSKYATREEKKGKGILKPKMIIPKNFFNEGEFKINVTVIDNMKHHIFTESSLLSFKVIPRPVELGDWMGKAKGSLKPDFKWKNKIIKY